jgi:hypothetical protein
VSGAREDLDLVDSSVGRRVEERPLAHRVAAVLALLALLAAGAVSAWWILTDRADFRGLAGRPAEQQTQPEP